MIAPPLFMMKIAVRSPAPNNKTGRYAIDDRTDLNGLSAARYSLSSRPNCQQVPPTARWTRALFMTENHPRPS